MTFSRSFSIDGVCKLEFFKRAVDGQPFHAQYYKKDRDPDVCGHTELPLYYKRVLSAIVFIPKIRIGWSAIFVTIIS